MKRHKLSSAICAIFGFSVYIPQVVAEDGAISATGDQGSASLDYIGSSFRLGIGYGEENQVQGDIFAVLYEKENASLMGEGWFSSSAGGLKLSWNWLPGVSDPQQIIDNPDGLTVYKTFIAADQNDRHDRKITAGFGLEKENYFYGAYLSKSITGRRSKRHSEDSTTFNENSSITGFENGHDFTQSTATTRIDTVFKDSYSHPYEWGIGFHGGKFWEAQLIRFRGGVDYEIGLRRGKTIHIDNSEKRENSLSGQVTASIGIEKYFHKTPFSFAIDVEHAQKYGPEETDKNDTRYLATLRYDFGQSHRQSDVYRDVEVATAADSGVGLAVTGVDDKQMVKNTVSLEKDAFFAFDKSVLSSSAHTTLDNIVHTIKSKGAEGNVRVTGHTCSIGSVSYNQDLSLRRAFAIRDYLVRQGIDSSMVDCIGEGEANPQYSNKTRDGRSKNRRTDIEFVTLEEAWDAEARLPAQAVPGTNWEKELIKQEPAWLRRALRNPVDHKRTVDVYKVANRRFEQTETVVLGEKVFANTDPIAVNDQQSVAKNSSNNSVLVLSNDRDPENDTLVITSFTQGSQGSVTKSNGQFLYTPATDFVGTDSFTYTVEDGFGGLATATVTINVEGSTNQIPGAVNDSVTVQQDSSGTVIDVMSNDTDLDSDTLTITSVTQPSNGTVVNNNGNVTYTPAPGFSGMDSFTYTVSDGNGGTSTAVVTVNVTAIEGPTEPEPPVNQVPVAGDDSATVNQDSASNVIDVLGNDSDPDGDNLTIVNISTPLHGSVVNNGGQLSYTPEPGYVGTDSFTYTIDDGNGNTVTATVTVNVIAVTPPPAENQAPVAVDDSIAVGQDSSANVIEVLSNDTDQEGDSLTIISFTDPANGIVINNNGNVSYTPDAGFVGTDSFTYTIDDGQGHTATATVTVTVEAATTTPPVVGGELQAVDDTFGLNLNETRVLDVLANDSGEELTIISVTSTRHSIVTIVDGGKAVEYQPLHNWCGTETFTYTIEDKDGNTATATVTVLTGIDLGHVPGER